MKVTPAILLIGLMVSLQMEISSTELASQSVTSDASVLNPEAINPDDQPKDGKAEGVGAGAVLKRTKRYMKKLKKMYKSTFYLNPGWTHSYNPVPTNPYIATVNSNYFPYPQYGILNFQNFPPPMPPPMNPNVGPQFSNFAGYVGPVGWLPEAYNSPPEDPSSPLFEPYKLLDY